MGLTKAYILPAGRIPELFTKIRDGQAPEQFSQQLLKDLGFTSSNDRAFIPLLKTLGFLTPDGKPTPRYHDYRDHSRSRSVMAKAIREAYEDLFLIKEHPTKSDKKAVEGKFKSYHNVSNNLAQLMTTTFFALLDLADLEAKGKGSVQKEGAAKAAQEPSPDVADKGLRRESLVAPTFHYNIQIHLPATKDVEVYNAIFKSLKEHVLGA